MAPRYKPVCCFRRLVLCHLYYLRSGNNSHIPPPRLQQGTPPSWTLTMMTMWVRWYKIPVHLSDLFPKQSADLTPESLKYSFAGESMDSEKQQQLSAWVALLWLWFWLSKLPRLSFAGSTTMPVMLRRPEDHKVVCSKPTEQALKRWLIYAQNRSGQYNLPEYAAH